MPNFIFPNETEYPSYLSYYIHKLTSEEDLLLTLQHQAQEVISLLEGVSEALMDESYAEGKWSIKELIIHLIDSERIFCTRALCFARGEKQTLPGYEEDDYVREAFAMERSKESLLEEYVANRISTLACFKGLVLGGRCC
jgi:uncharacterized damage-inducible protein DinB